MIKTYTVSGDTHTPWHSKWMHKGYLDFLKYLRPDGFIINGDFIDMYSVSRHITGILDLEDNVSKGLIKLKDEFDGANKVLDDYDKVLPKNCEKFYNEGNHENRLTRWLNEGFNGVLEGLISVQSCLNLEKRGYETNFGYPNAYLELGKLIVTHGAWTPLHTAAKHLNEYRQSVLFSHTHTSQLFYAGGLGTKQAAFGIGCMCDMNSQAMGYAKKTSRWVNGFGVVHVDTQTGHFWVEIVNAFDETFVYNKKVFGKRT